MSNELKKILDGLGFSPINKAPIACEREQIPTPSYDLNRILLGDLYNGLQSRTVYGIVGPEGTFKSSFSVLSMCEAIKFGYTPIIIDSEGSYTPEFIERWGLNPNNTFYKFCNFVEQVKITLYGLIKSGQQKFIVSLDSLAGLDKEKIFDDLDKKDGAPKADMGALAKDIKSMYKFIVALTKMTNSICIVTSHMYSGTGLFPTKHISGGTGILYYSDVLIKLKKEQLKTGSDIYGNSITAQTIKNRYYPPFQEATIQLDYKNGINKHAGLLDLLVECGEVEKSGSWYSLSSGERLGQGADKASEALLEMPELLEKLNSYLKETGYSKQNSKLLEEGEKLLNSVEKEFSEEEEHFDINKEGEKLVEVETKPVKKVKKKK